MATKLKLKGLKLSELRKVAKDLGIAPSEVRSASTASELRETITEFQGGNGSRKKSTAKKVVKKAVGKTTGAKRGRPKGSKNSTSKTTPAKSRNSGKAKRSSAAAEGNGGRFLLGKINYNDDDGWNPRDGSAPDRIVKSLRKFKGDRTKVFTALKGDVWDFCSKRLKDGTKRKLDDGSRYSAYNMLRYRIARTDWDFAIKTGQHESSEDRVEYGTGGFGEGIYGNGKKKKSTKSAKNSTSTKPTGKKRGRPPGTKNKAKVTAKASTGKKRGRPPGSKNKKRK